MRQNNVFRFPLLVVIAGVLGVWYLGGHSARGDNASRMNEVNRPGSGVGATGPVPVRDDASEVEPSPGPRESVDEQLRKKTELPDLAKFMKGWDKDAKYEADLISKETFAETLENTADYEQNYFRLVFSDCLDHPAISENLHMIVMSRRFAKLVEEMRDAGPSPEQVDELLTRLRNDLSKLRGMKAKDPEFSHSSNFVGGANDPALDDQSDLPMALGWRLNASEVLIGQFVIQEGLPLLLESLDTRDGTYLKNWTSVAYACDKILSAKPIRELTQGQHQVRDEYLKWKAGLPETSPGGSSELHMFNRHFFEYERVKVPSYRSPRRPHERATAMGAPLDYVSYGTVIIEIPPGMPGEGIDIGTLQPRPQVDIVAFARRFLEAGQSTE